ncbi:hypothetical protein ZIOFF_025315 [Zingiber officinale]|uniref:Uncharacterized protein n=1 Tax=Zingiber officinale TaxID=94328 RepID=A0A8J5LEC1_ZINOF|nr:hypothetical protein ZIOFF_025315 [Zingiber officinale]
MVHRSFFLGKAELAALRRCVPEHLRNNSTFEILTAFLWKCRIITIGANTEKEFRIIYVVIARDKSGLCLPAGYYGNAFALPASVSTAGKLSSNPIGYALDLVKKAKSAVNDEYMRDVEFQEDGAWNWSTNMVLIQEEEQVKEKEPTLLPSPTSSSPLDEEDPPPQKTMVRTYLVSDMTWARFGDVDFGWGKAAYGCPAKGGVEAIPGVGSFYAPLNNSKGEEGIVVPVCLLALAMGKFTQEMHNLMEEDDGNDAKEQQPQGTNIVSKL